MADQHVGRFASALLAIALPLHAPAQDQGAAPSGSADARKARILELVGRDSGEITAMEPSLLQDGGVLVGHATGSVMRCAASQRCEEFVGTPNVAVESIAVAPRGATEVVWVAYRQGALYRCADASCEKFPNTP